MPGNGLASVEHVVGLMLENRSFDHMLGFLYTSAGNMSPSGQPYEGLTGTESNPGSSGNPVTVSQIQPSTPNAYFMPGFGDVLTLAAPRTDDVLAGVTVPVSGSAGPAAGTLSHLEAIREDLATRFSPAARPEPPAARPEPVP